MLTFNVTPRCSLNLKIIYGKTFWWINLKSYRVRLYWYKEYSKNVVWSEHSTIFCPVLKRNHLSKMPIQRSGKIFFCPIMKLRQNLNAPNVLTNGHRKKKEKERKKRRIPRSRSYTHSRQSQNSLTSRWFPVKICNTYVYEKIYRETRYFFFFLADGRRQIPLCARVQFRDETLGCFLLLFSPLLIWYFFFLCAPANSSKKTEKRERERALASQVVGVVAVPHTQCGIIRGLISKE